MLSRHPEIAFPLGKEVHFWNRATSISKPEVNRYLQSFNQPTLVEGEITPAYAMLGEAVLRVIYSLLPDVRLIFLIRNPIDRAWSSANMARRRAELDISEVSTRWYLDHFHSAGSLGRGDYESTLRRWRKVFGFEAVLLLRYEEIAENPRNLLLKVARHLGVDAEGFRSIPQAVLEERVFDGDGEALPQRLREELERLYRPRIRSLDRYLCEPTGW